MQTILKHLFEEFCSSTTIHGMHYIGASKTLLGRIGWMIAFVFSVLCCGMLIQNVYQKWDNSPVIVSFDDAPTPVWKIPFPAITVCSEDKIMKFFYKETEFLSMRRGELFGLTDFIANCGGILGLCLGISFVSLVELLYYCAALPLLLVKEGTCHNGKVVIVIVKERVAMDDFEFSTDTSPKKNICY
ncbi:hypothetical protein quinque_005767 [Culex quinquefasciatus]